MELGRRAIVVASSWHHGVVLACRRWGVQCDRSRITKMLLRSTTVTLRWYYDATTKVLRFFWTCPKTSWSFQVSSRSIKAHHELLRSTTNFVPTPLRFLKFQNRDRPYENSRMWERGFRGFPANMMLLGHDLPNTNSRQWLGEESVIWIGYGLVQRLNNYYVHEKGKTIWPNQEARTELSSERDKIELTQKNMSLLL